jgi:biopolymer transport protein ExbD
MQQASGLKHFEYDSQSAVKADINVTPLVDVCLVLLIIFMVVTPLLTQGHPVQLPETDKPEKMPQGAKQLNVAIEQDGSVFIEDKWVPADKLVEQFGKIHEATPDKEVVIKADKRLKYAEVRKVLKALNGVGFPGAGLETHRKNANRLNAGAT